MRQAPLNYLVAIVVGCLFWVGTAIFAGQQLGDSVELRSLTTGQFVQIYQTVVAIAAACGIVGCLYWFFYGSRDSVAGRIHEAPRTWAILFTTQLAVAAVALVILVVMFRAEALTIANFLEMAGLLLLQTVVVFWACTYVMSPPAVEFIPWGKR